MSSNDTNHCMQEFEQGGNLIPSLHCKSSTSVEHNNEDYHHYQIATDDDDDIPVSRRLSKRHRAYTNLTALCSSTSLTKMGNKDSYIEAGVQNSSRALCAYSDYHATSSDDSSDGWGYYVDTL